MTRRELIQNLKEAHDICMGTSTGMCKAGQCIFSSKDQYGCIFESMGMNQPPDWDREVIDNDGC